MSALDDSYSQMGSAMIHLVHLIEECQWKHYEQAEKLALAFNHIATALGPEGVEKALEAYDRS